MFVALLRNEQFIVSDLNTTTGSESLLRGCGQIYLWNAHWQGQSFYRHSVRHMTFLLSGPGSKERKSGERTSEDGPGYRMTSKLGRSHNTPYSDKLPGHGQIIHSWHTGILTISEFLDSRCNFAEMGNQRKMEIVWTLIDAVFISPYEYRTYATVWTVWTWTW